MQIHNSALDQKRANEAAAGVGCQDYGNPLGPGVTQLTSGRYCFLAQLSAYLLRNRDTAARSHPRPISIHLRSFSPVPCWGAVGHVMDHPFQWSREQNTHQGAFGVTAVIKEVREMNILSETLSGRATLSIWRVLRANGSRWAGFNEGKNSGVVLSLKDLWMR